MSGQQLHKRAPNKAVWGHEKIAEKQARLEEHEADYMSHERNTKQVRDTFVTFTAKVDRHEQIIRDCEAEIAGLPTRREALERKIAEQKGVLSGYKAQHGAAARAGEVATQKKAKYDAYLALETDELNL